MSQNTEGKSVMVQGRIVWVSGDLFKGKPKVDQTTKLQKFDKQGNPAIEYGFGLAVPKAAFQPGQPAAALWEAIHEAAFTLYPSRQLPPGFAWKYKDGDGVDHNGQPFNTREGHSGHLIFACTTSIPIKYFIWQNGNNVQIAEGIKCGDYVNVQLNLKAHPPSGAGKAGLYLNPNAVQLLGYGKEIINAPSGDQIFGAVQPPMPQGASAQPVAPQGQNLLVPPQAMPAPGAPPVYQPPVAVAQPVQPHFAVLPQVHQPPPGGMPAPGNGHPPVGSPWPGGFPAPAAAATPMAPPMGAPSYAAPVNYAPQATAMPNGMPPIPR